MVSRIAAKANNIQHFLLDGDLILDFLTGGRTRVSVGCGNELHPDLLPAAEQRLPRPTGTIVE